MPIRERQTSSVDRLLVGLLLLNRYLFTAFFWKQDMSIPEDRDDLPARWRGRQMITLEQRLMILDENPAVVFCTSRKSGKTLIEEARFIHYGIVHTRRSGSADEALLFAPREHHMRPLVSRLRNRIERVPLFRLLLKNWNRSEGTAEFPNLTWFTRIEGNQRSGQNFVGLRAVYGIGDEMAFFGQEAWPELQNTFMPRTPRLYAGVPNGVRGTPFWQLTATKLGATYSIHRCPITANPLYHSMEALLDEAVKHGGAKTQGFITQVMGEWGEEAMMTFPILPTETFPFNLRHLRGDECRRAGFSHWMEMVIGPDEGYEEFAISGDVGLTASPTVLIVAGYKQDTWWERARIVLVGTDTTQIAQLVDFINMRILPKRAMVISLDAHGIGTGVISTLHSDAELLSHDLYPQKAFDAGFASFILDHSMMTHKACGTRVRVVEPDIMWACDTCHVLVGPEEVKPAGIPAKQYLTERCKDVFSNAFHWLEAGKPPYAEHLKPRFVLNAADEELQRELGGVTESKTPQGYIKYTPLEGGKAHNTDAVLALIAGISSAASIEEGPMESDVSEYGWVNLGEFGMSPGHIMPWEVARD